jgi:hypothetical protein
MSSAQTLFCKRGNYFGHQVMFIYALGAFFGALDQQPFQIRVQLLIVIESLRLAVVSNCIRSHFCHLLYTAPIHTLVIYYTNGDNFKNKQEIVSIT